jgi:hypothetical protein
MKALVVVNGFIGDCLFASSVAKGLKEKMGYLQVDYLIQVVQPRFLLEADPWIDKVYWVNDDSGPTLEYDNVIQLGAIQQDRPVTIQYQEQAGLSEQELAYKVNTVQLYDFKAQRKLNELTNQYPSKVIAFQANWEEKSFRFTKEEYWRGVDVPYKGYGGSLRDTNVIKQILLRKFIVIEVGFPIGVSQQVPIAIDPYKFAADASVIKVCDYMVGGEGGLTNLSAGIGTKTIITSDYIAQLYGPNGVLKKFKEPKMGPTTYFPDAGHSLLNPYLSDEEVGVHITNIIDSDVPEVFQWTGM